MPDEKEPEMILPVERRGLLNLNLDDVAAVFQKALEENFAVVSVKVVECPDLTLAPYRMAGKGLCGATKIADVGGVGYMQPVPQLQHKYSLHDIASLTESSEGCFLLGAGAGPYQEIGCNCELMVNAFIASDGKTNIASQVAKLDENEKCIVSGLTTPNLAILGNFFISKGESGKVLEVRVKRRTGSENFVSVMRQALKKSSPGSAVGVGGVFIVEKGSVKIHVMPDFSSTPLDSSDAVDKWLHYFTFPAPMIFQSVFVSEDPGLDLRMEHTHGYSLMDESGKCRESHGGHYHYDTTPEDVEYLGYFNVAEALYRIDRPGSN